MSMQIPFSVYDFFGYLASGFLFLIALDFAFLGQGLLDRQYNIASGIFAVIITYVLGQILASIASAVLEQGVVRKLLRSPEETLFENRKQRWSWLFPGFFKPFPPETSKRILEKSKELAGIEQAGRSLFFHCHPIVKRDKATIERLSDFLRLYGFSRNISLAVFISAVMLVVSALIEKRATGVLPTDRAWWAITALAVSVGMLYRYLKFFRHYIVEVFITYAEN